MIVRSRELEKLFLAAEERSLSVGLEVQVEPHRKGPQPETGRKFERLTVGTAGKPPVLAAYFGAEQDVDDTARRLREMLESRR